MSWVLFTCIFIDSTEEVTWLHNVQENNCSVSCVVWFCCSEVLITSTLFEVFLPVQLRSMWLVSERLSMKLLGQLLQEKSLSFKWTVLMCLLRLAEMFDWYVHCLHWNGLTVPKNLISSLESWRSDGQTLLLFWYSILDLKFEEQAWQL